MAVTAEAVKAVRERTGAGIIECKNALEEAKGNIEVAVESLHKRGIAKGIALAAKKAGAGGQGIVSSYIHQGSRIGVMIELTCETDFVARTEEFKALAHNISMQIAAMSPKYVGDGDLPEAPEGALAEISLLHQPFIREPTKTIKDLVAELIGKVGENIRVRRFVRFELGG